MSVVAIIKDKDRVWVGCDSQVSFAGTKWTLKNQHKIWKPSDDKEIVMGGVGYLRDINILSTTTNWIDELTKLKNGVNFKHIVRNIVPKLFKELEEFNRIETKNGIKSMDSSFAFTYKNSAFVIDGDGCVIEVDDINIIGSGFRFGLGLWENIKNSENMSIKEKLIEVVKSCCENDLHVYYPIVIMNTKDDKIEIINK